MKGDFTGNHRIEIAAVARMCACGTASDTG